MEKLKALLFLLLMPVLAILIPTLSPTEDITQLLGSFAGVAGLVVIGTQALKEELVYKLGVKWKYLPQTLSVSISIVISIIASWLDLGLFASIENIFHAIVIGILISGVSNGWYDVPFVKQWAKILFRTTEKLY